MSSEKKTFQRLPSDVVPVNYDLLLKPDLNKFTFDGEQNISIQVRKETSTIVLNANELVISNDGLFVTVGDKNITVENVVYCNDQETATICLKESLPKGDANLFMKFTGTLNDKLLGFYRSKYTAPDGVVRHIACTQFEATDARRAFPCWDEPACKATFDISYVIPHDGKTIGLSNMNVIGEEVVEGSFKKIRFARTPVMSTYLVAFVIGEFDYLETFSQDGVRVRVYTPLGKKQQGQFGLEVCAKSLDYYREYFKIAYPLNKMDLIAIPDFASGAMENWGLVTYRETCLLVDTENSSTLRRQYVALVIAHELAHQWFGNLVTMEWWTHLWLNEGFASFIEHLCVDDLFPKFNIWTQFVSDTFLEAMEADGLDNSHPIEVPVGHPSEVDEIFDNISYNKGASVIRMLYNFIGDDFFRKGMNLYLSRHSYKNAETEQLWDALEEVSNKPVRRVMSTWTKQKGYPIVSVSVGTNGKIKLHQKKFRMMGALSGEDAKMLWAVPLRIITATSGQAPKVDTLMESRETDLELTLGSDEWIKLNPAAVCTYRVCYSSELLARFIPAIQVGSLQPLDRLNLLDDLFAMVIAGKSKTVDLLKFLSAFENEKDYTVWRSLNNCLGKLNQLFSSTGFHQKFCDFGLNLLNKTVFPHIGWSAKPDEPYLDTLLRPLVIGKLVGFQDQAVLAQCKRLFQEHLAGQLVSADLRAPTYRAMAIQGDEAIFDQLLQLYTKAEFQEEKNRLSTSLGATTNPALIQRVLEFAVSDQVRNQDTVSVIAHLAFNPSARGAVWLFFQERKAFFAARYESGFLLSHLVKSITENFTTEESAQEIEQFFKTNPFPGTERCVQQSIETIRLNAALLQRDSQEVAQFFQ